jgi:hypothetical protein
MARRCVCALIALSALLLTGCMRVSAELRVEDDGSGTFRALIAADRARIGDALVGIDAAAIEAIFPPASTVQAALPAGSTVEPYADGGFDGYVVTAPFAQPVDLETILASLQGVVGAPAIGSLVLEPDGDGWRFESSMSSAADDPVGTARTVLGTLAPGDLTEEQLDQVLEGLVLEFSVHLPGQVVEHNADRVTADGTLVWDLTASDGARTLSARSQPGDPVTGDGAPSLVAQPTGGATDGATSAETGTDTDPVDEPAASTGSTTASDTAVASDGAEAATDETDDDGGGSAIVLVIVGLVVVAAVVALVVVLRGRSRRGGPPAPGAPVGWSGPGAGPVPASPPAPGAPSPAGSPRVDAPNPALDPSWTPIPTAVAPVAPGAPTSGPEADRWAPPPTPPAPDLGATRVLPAWGTDPDAPPDAPPPPMPTDPTPAGPSGPPAPPAPPRPQG